VAILALRFSRVDCGPAKPAQDVGSMRHDFEMIDVDARLVPAQMV
jgi:hypothetical protein